MNIKEVWFSHREKKWNVTESGIFSWTDKEEIGRVERLAKIYIV